MLGFIQGEKITSTDSVETRERKKWTEERLPFGIWFLDEAFVHCLFFADAKLLWTSLFREWIYRWVEIWVMLRFINWVESSLLPEWQMLWVMLGWADWCLVNVGPWLGGPAIRETKTVSNMRQPGRHICNAVTAGTKQIDLSPALASDGTQTILNGCTEGESMYSRVIVTVLTQDKGHWCQWPWHQVITELN